MWPALSPADWILIGLGIAGPILALFGFNIYRRKRKERGR
ncbi:MAG: hypothetical protein K0S39_5566 [Paenibacillus sp.]|jgi:hypothetical protein|nr:hypothetical protein [Paenibacillus sp.]